jgi:hypothetical protein
MKGDTNLLEQYHRNYRYFEITSRKSDLSKPLISYRIWATNNLAGIVISVKI